MARFALQDSELFYGVYEAESLDLAIFHLLTRAPFSISALKYDQVRKQFEYTGCSSRCGDLYIAIHGVAEGANEISRIVSELNKHSFEVTEGVIVLWNKNEAVAVDIGDVEAYETAEDKGLEPWFGKNDILCLNETLTF